VTEQQARSSLASGVEAFIPPKRLRVSEAIAQSLMIDQPGGYVGLWSPDQAPYMIEPADTLASRQHDALCFVGPARSSKTMTLVDGWIARNVTADPGDMLVVQMSQEKAREFSKVRVDRAIRNSPALREWMTARGHDDNTYDKMFRHGMWLKIGWPSASQLSGSDYRYVAITDRDRMDDDIDGEGDVFMLGLKRTQTFHTRGMCMVESSPGRDITDVSWRAATPHEAPPCSGILGIYNRSDRRRFYWRCPDCGERFEAKPGLALFSTLPSEEELLQMVRAENLPKLAAHHAKVVCPWCTVLLGHELKQKMNAAGRWLADGLRFVGEKTEGEPHSSKIAGFWLGGVAAAYQAWDSMLLRYLQGLREFELSGAEETLKTTVNTDQSMPFLPRALGAANDARPADRTEKLARYTVPDGARFLIASVDVQGGKASRFVVQVKAFGPGLEGWIVDRYDIRHSPRGKAGAAVQIDPAAYPEDWDVITDKVVNATYRTSGERELRVLLTVVDSGGEEGVTPSAYAWFRRARKAGLTDRVMLIKGASKKPISPVVKASARDARGITIRDIVLNEIDTNFFKDIVAASLRRTESGPGFMHFPDWLPQSFFEELFAEKRDAKKGKWIQMRARNESLDLWTYALAGCWKLGAHKIDWAEPPRWAMPLEQNSESMAPEVRREMKAGREEESDDADIFAPISM
jgi:phage terminase large subunit GpA-like protein